VLELVEEKYADFGPTLAAEMLADHHGFIVSSETLRKWMIERGLWLPRKQRRRFHQPRNRRECFGELIQIDGSDHRWNTSQAKGRVERANRTLQDRLVKELRLRNISDMAAGNAFLKEYKDRFNQQFMKLAAKSDNLHRAMNVEPDRLSDVLCLRDQRHIGQQLTFKYSNRKISRLQA